MGFIEKLRQEKAKQEAEEVRRRTLKAIIEVTRTEARNRSEEARATTYQEMLSRRERAQKYYQESGCGDLINRLCQLKPSIRVTIPRFPEESKVNSITGRTLVSVPEFPYLPSSLFRGDLMGYEKNSKTGELLSNGLGSYLVFLEWEDSNLKPRFGSGLLKEQSLIVIESCPDGNIHFYGKRLLGSSTVGTGQWHKDRTALENALEKTYYHPMMTRYKQGEPSYDGRGGENRGPCLPGYIPISTPLGLISIKDLKVGDFVWTTDRFGRKVKSRIIQKCRRLVSINHKIAHLILKDGREIFVSAYHPTIEGTPIIKLKKGQIFDNSLVLSIKLIAYNDKYTYDILPEGDTGGYWANNILMGSTLFDKFETSLNYP